MDHQRDHDYCNCEPDKHTSGLHHLTWFRPNYSAYPAYSNCRRGENYFLIATHSLRARESATAWTTRM